MLLFTLVASLLGNQLACKSTIRASKGTVSAGKGTVRASQDF